MNHKKSCLTPAKRIQFLSLVSKPRSESCVFVPTEEGCIPALSGTDSAGALVAFSLVPAVIGSDSLYDSCDASGTSVAPSVSALDDCYSFGRISPTPKGVDPLEGAAIAVIGGSYGRGSVPQGDRLTHPYWDGEHCVWATRNGRFGQQCEGRCISIT